MATSPQLLIDGDLFLYKATAAAEFEAQAGDDTWFLSTNLQQAKAMWSSMMTTISKELGSQDLVIVLSGPEDFRRALCDSYKGNRKDKRKPLGYPVLKQWLYEQYPDRVLMQPSLEADDYLGILATTPNAVERIVVSDDKDLKTVPCRLYRLGVMSSISVEEADHNWLMQTLTGDPADGYKGCPGVGPVKALAILNKPGLAWENVRQAFLKAGTDEEYAFLQARLARILRFEDWDSERKLPKLWTPAH